jgi:hypothetical protein
LYIAQPADPPWSDKSDTSAWPRMDRIRDLPSTGTVHQPAASPPGVWESRVTISVHLICCHWNNACSFGKFQPVSLWLAVTGLRAAQPTNLTPVVIYSASPQHFNGSGDPSRSLYSICDGLHTRPFTCLT